MFYLSILIYIYLELNQFVNQFDTTSSNAKARFNYLNVYPSAPRAGQPLHLNSNIKNPGNVSKWNVKWKIKFGFIVLLSGIAELCGFKNITLPHDLGSLQVHELKCSDSPGNFNFQAIALITRIPRCVDKVGIELRVVDEKHKELLGLDLEFIKDKDEVLMLNNKCERKKLSEIIKDYVYEQNNNNNDSQLIQSTRDRNKCLNRIILNGNHCQEICKIFSKENINANSNNNCIKNGYTKFSKLHNVSKFNFLTYIRGDE